jgi:hypothetical protein
VKEVKNQGLERDLLYLATGDIGINIRKGDKIIGNLTRIIEARDEKSNTIKLKLQLLPKESVTLVFVFDSPKESKPQTLSWPKVGSIELR